MIRHFLFPKSLNLALLSLAGALLACTNLSPSTPVPSGSQQPTEPSSTAPVAQPEQPTVAQPPLTAEQIPRLAADFQEKVNVSLDLLGIDRLIIPPYSPELANYRQDWVSVNPEVAPLLGTWVGINDLLPNKLVIVPSAIANQVCVIDHQTRYRYELNAESMDSFTRVSTAPAEEMSIFESLQVEVVNVRETQAQTSRLRFHPDLVQQVSPNWAPLTFEFLGAVDAADQVLLYAAQSPAQLDANWPAEIQQTLAEHQCQIERPE